MQLVPKWGNTTFGNGETFQARCRKFLSEVNKFPNRSPSLHLLSPLTQERFTSVIIMSGHPYLMVDPPDVAMKNSEGYTAALGCNGNQVGEIILRLRFGFMQYTIVIIYIAINLQLRQTMIGFS